MNFLYVCVLAWRFKKSFYGTKNPVRCSHPMGFFYVELKRLLREDEKNNLPV